MKHLSRRTFSIGLALGVGMGLLSLPPQALAEWKPQKPVEFVIMAGQGGGADRLARLIQSIIEKNGYSNQPFIPINKGGGSGAEALRYLKDKAGDPHVIMATLNSLYTTPLRNPGIGVNIEELTPIARLAEDTFVLWVNSESDINSVEDYVKAVKAAGTSWKMGGTGTGQEDSLVTAMLERAYDLKVTYVPFKGGGTVAKNLIGKHVDSTVNNPSEQLGFFQAGKSRPLAAFTPDRLAAFPDVPTFGELGKSDMVYYMQRSVMGPPNMPADARAFYEGVFQKVHESAEWKKYTEEKSLQRAWLTGDALMKYFIDEREKHRAILKDMGEIQ